MEVETQQGQNATVGAQKDVYAIITEKIIEKLENGIIPWQKLWGESGPPTNLVSKQPYKGINALLLGMEEYEHNYFLTFDQVNQIGGKVRRGSKGHVIVSMSKPGNPADGNELQIKCYSVFNVAQCENIPENYLSVLQEHPAPLNCEHIIASMPNAPKIGHKEPTVSYDVVADLMNMPKKLSNKKDMGYYALLFRQLLHSTGHDARLHRKGVAEISEVAGKQLYSKEDLVADIGLCFLLSVANLSPTFSNHKDYVAGWIAKLRTDKKVAVIAAGQAQKAVDYILNAKEDTKHSQPQE